MLDRNGLARGVKEPHANCSYEHNHDEHSKEQSRDIRRTELSDTWHLAIIYINQVVDGRVPCRPDGVKL
jgi:hypothetical protein